MISLNFTLHGWNHLLPVFGRMDRYTSNCGGLNHGGITLEYIMALNSSFARAVDPAIKHAMNNGFLDHIESERPRPVECANEAAT